jgi:hypothetical protein
MRAPAGESQRTENSNLTVVSRHPVSGRGQPPGWFILPAPPPSGAMATEGGGGIEPPGSAVERKAGYSKATVSPAHPLATEPGTPVRFTFRAPGGSRTLTSEDTRS